MSDTNHTATPVETANEVVTAEVKVAQNSHDHENKLSSAAEKLANHAEGKPECAELVGICRDWAKFEQNHIDALKKYL